MFCAIVGALLLVFVVLPVIVYVVAETLYWS